MRMVGSRASRAIMTTDTRPKLISRQFQLDGETITVTGIAKGAGMIRPDMATMLAYLATDLAVQPALLQQCLEQAVHPSFNSISVDGDTSTNDACMLLASGVSPHGRGNRCRLPCVQQSVRGSERGLHGTCQGNWCGTPRAPPSWSRSWSATPADEGGGTAGRLHYRPLAVGEDRAVRPVTPNWGRHSGLPVGPAPGLPGSGYRTDRDLA